MRIWSACGPKSRAGVPAPCATRERDSGSSTTEASVYDDRAAEPRHALRDGEIVEFIGLVAVGADADLSLGQACVSNGGEVLVVDRCADDRSVELEAEAVPPVEP